jgi:opacity protein-like surface antigen
MIHGFFRKTMAVIAATLMSAGAVSAQNYDGSGIVRFGIFGAGEFYDLKRSPDTVGSTSLDGGAVGFAAGYDLVFARRMVLGIETDLQVGDTRGRLNGVDLRTHADYLATLRGRLGFFLMPELLVYGTGGVAWAGLGIEDTAGSLALGSLDANKTVTGWVAGGGMEYDFRDYLGTIFFAEYLVGGFGSWNNIPGLGFDLDADVQTFRIGMKFKVGHDYHDDYRRGGSLK